MDFVWLVQVHAGHLPAVGVLRGAVLLLHIHNSVTAPGADLTRPGDEESVPRRRVAGPLRPLPGLRDDAPQDVGRCTLRRCTPAGASRGVCCSRRQLPSAALAAGILYLYLHKLFKFHILIYISLFFHLTL